MAEIETFAGDEIPGAGPASWRGKVIPVPFGPITAGVKVFSRACDLMGWSVRETTGVSAALLDIFDGSDGNGTFVGCAELAQGVNAAEAGLAPNTAEGTALAPGANGVVANTGQVGTGNPWPVGLYQLSGEVAYGAAAGAANDFKLVEAGIATITVLECPPVANGAPTPFNITWLKTGSSVFQVQAIAGAAGNYIATLTVTPLLSGAGSGVSQWLGDAGVRCSSGVFLNPVAGSIRGSIWVRI